MTTRLHHLIEQHITGRLTSSEEKELHQLLSESAENRDIFCTQGLIDGRLRWEMENATSGLTLVQSHQSQPATKKWMAKRWTALAALLILALIAGSLIRTQFGSSDTGDPQPGNQTANVAGANEPIRTVARLTAEKEAYWLINGTQQTLASGSWLSPGEWIITQGTATITLDSGAKITAVAPVCVELINSNHARLIDGTVSVDVPEPAIGFTLDTPAGRIVDLSTRFSVSVEKGQHEEVHVLEGEVIVHYGDDHQQSQLIGNQSAIRLNKSGRSSKLSPASFRPGSYPREVAFTPASLTQERGYVHWSFDAQDEARVFEADGTLEGAQSCNAQVVSPQRNQSLHTTKGIYNQALHLNGDGTWLKTNFPGIAGAKARTIAFWVRIPPHARDSQAYSIIGWGYSDPHHSPQKWEIGWNTARFPVHGTGVKGAVRTDFGSGHTIGSTDLRDGRWHHIVSVFTGGEHADAATHIRHYVDGRFEGVSAYRQQAIDTETDTAKSIPAVIGKYLHPHDQIFGTFHGSIDELYVFNAALTPSQILRLKQTNTPPASEEMLPTPET